MQRYYENCQQIFIEVDIEDMKIKAKMVER